jgi:DNA-binding MarR family transcriptional regulator
VIDRELVSLRETMPAHAARMVSLNITPQQMCALMTLEFNDGLSTSAVCEAMGVKANVASGIVQRLVERGYVSREDSESDRRVRLLHLTAQGREFAEGMTAGLKELRRMQFDALSDEQLEQLYAIQETMALAGHAAPITIP